MIMFLKITISGPGLINPFLIKAGTIKELQRDLCPCEVKYFVTFLFEALIFA